MNKNKAKSIVFILGVLAYLSCSGTAPAYPPVQNRGAVSTGTITVVSVTTTPAMLLSTGTNIVYGDQETPIFVPTNTARSVGTYMNDRIQMEIFNDSAVDIFIGYNNQVSSVNGSNYGRRISSGTAWSHDCDIQQHWAVSGSSTGYNVVITQEK